MAASKIRLFVDHTLAKGQCVGLNRDQAHYVFGVMRQGVGDTLNLFNGNQGEWSARVTEAGKRSGRLTVDAKTAEQRDPPDLWLIFAPIKKARTDFIVEKATEMGAARILPVQTEFTNSERIRQERLQAHAIEAAEQCGGTFVPKVEELQKLSAVLKSWPQGRHLMFCDEMTAGAALTLSDDLGGTPGAILIGPEGGFSASERETLTGLPFTHPVSLGPRVLRADTAAVAALALWQTTLGDWL